MKIRQTLFIYPAALLSAALLVGFTLAYTSTRSTWAEQGTTNSLTGPSDWLGI
ncbi:hypothetical protein [Spirosoma fluminis]